MYKNEDFRLKLILPCRFEPNKLDYLRTLNQYFYFHLPYGMGVLASFLRKHNYYVEQEDLSVKFNRRMKGIDLDIDRNTEEIRGFLKSGEVKGRLSLFIDKLLDSVSMEGFGVMGFSVVSNRHFIFALMLAKKIKQRVNIPIVFGGPFITLYGQLYPGVFNYVDYMIVGDGSIPLLRLIDYLKNKITISEVPNLIYRSNAKLITNPKIHYHLEDTPIPDFSDLPLKLYKNPCLDYPIYSIKLPYQITRGCTNNCSFCVNKCIHERLEFKSYGKVLSELSQMKEKYKSKKFYFYDVALNNSYEYLEGLCDLFIKNRLDISWFGQVKVGNLDKYILKKMREAGCYVLDCGIESASDRMLERMNKGFTAEQASKTLKDASEAGLKIHIGLIVGYPHETQADIEETAGFIRKNRKYIYYTSISRFSLTYGSPIYRNPESYSVTNLRPSVPHFCFAFDESGGLKWQQKEKQQEDSERQIIKVVHKNAGFNSKLLVFYSCCIRLFGYIIAKIKKTCLSIQLIKSKKKPVAVYL